MSNHSNNKIVRFTHAIIRHKWLVLIGVILSVLAAASGGKYLSFTSDYRVWFSPENPQLVAYEKMQAVYSRNDNVLFVVQPKDKNVFTQRTMQAVYELTEKSWQMPYSNRVDSLTNHQHTYAEDDDLTVIDLVEDPNSLDTNALEELKRVALTEPMLANRLISPDSTTTGVNVTVQLPQKDPAESAEIMMFARNLADEIQAKYPELHIAMSGMIPLNVAFFEASMQDMSTLTPLMYIVILLVSLLILRSIATTFTLLLVIAFSTAFAMGIAGWMGVALTPASAIAPTIILTLAVADSIHVFVTMLREMRSGSSKQDALAESMRVNFQPIFLTSITTAIGFLSLNASDAPPFHDLGNISAIGVMVAFAYSVIFLPAMISILPMRIKVTSTTNDSTSDRPARMMQAFGNWVLARFRKIFVISALIIAALATTIPNLILDDRWIEYFDNSIEFRRDSDFATKNLSGPYIVEFALESGIENGVSDPEFIRKVDNFTYWLRNHHWTDHVLSITDTLKRLNMNMHGDDSEQYLLPENRELAAQYLLLYEMSLPYGLDLTNQINVSKSATRVAVTLKDISTAEMRKFNAEAEVWLKDHHLESDGGTGPTMMFSYISQRNINGMLTGTGISLVIISLILIFALRSLRLGLISLVPNLIPAVAAFGLWSLTVNQIGMGVSVVVAMCLGIIVDDTVHFLSKYARGMREKNLDSADAIRYAFSSAGVALVVTSVIIVAGFIILGTSAFKVNSHMGLLNAVIITSALVIDFLMLPALLMFFCRRSALQKKDSKPSIKKDTIMKTIAAISIFALTAAISSPALARTADEILSSNGTPKEIGLAIAKESDARDLGFGDSKADMEMVLKNSAGDTSTRRIRISTLENIDPDDGDKSIVIFDTPKDVRGTALLSHAHFLDSDDQWLRLPALTGNRKIKRIASRNKSGPFVGSEFAFEDMTATEMMKYDYTYLRSESCGTLQCFVVERTPLYKHSGYTRQIGWIDHEEFRIQKVEFYDRKNALLKTLEMNDYRQYLTKYWRAHDLYMKNHITEKSTRLTTHTITFNNQLDSSDFTKAALQRMK